MSNMTDAEMLTATRESMLRERTMRKQLEADLAVANARIAALEAALPDADRLEYFAGQCEWMPVDMAREMRAMAERIRAYREKYPEQAGKERE